MQLQSLTYSNPLRIEMSSSFAIKEEITTAQERQGNYSRDFKHRFHQGKENRNRTSCSQSVGLDLWSQRQSNA
ncbi:hypothetical protein INR49_030675 [Caranx melampygus]|nr:hypothetical protein INR49_030675 [Caranx melampygus]